MNKNHLNSSMNNYLINASLFKNNQKNRMVSSYVSHRNYFAEEETPKHRNQMNIPNVTKSKKQQIILPNDGIQLREVQENKNDALQATVKKDVSNEPFLQNNNKQISKVAQPILIRQELPSIKQVSKDNEENVINQLERQKQIQRKLQIEKEQEVLREKQRERQRQIQRQRQRLLQSEMQRQRQLERQRLLAKEREKEKQDVQRKSFHPLNEQNQGKIIVHYSQKGKGIKMQGKDVQNFNRQLSKNNQNKYNQHHSKYMRYNRQQQQYQQSQVNPYLPTTEKKDRQATKQPTPKIFSSTKKSLSIHPAFSLIRQMPRQSTINNKHQKESQIKNEETDHMVNIRKDMSGYLASVKQKLNNSYICLQTVQCDFQLQIEKALQSQCQRLRLILYGLIDQEINGFKEFERREFSKSKFYFMSDLYEIKCNIDLRLQEIQHYQLQLKNQYKWKEFANNILGINYNQNINFILKKSDQIQTQLTSNVNPQLNYYAKSLNEEFIANMRKVIKEQFGKVYQNFDKNKFKSKPLILKQRQ